MKTATREWVDKAEADYAAALMLRRSRKQYSRDIVCFHLQQCMEKYLKARIEEASLAFPKTHDLENCLTWPWLLSRFGPCFDLPWPP